MMRDPFLEIVYNQSKDFTLEQLCETLERIYEGFAQKPDLTLQESLQFMMAGLTAYMGILGTTLEALEVAGKTLELTREALYLLEDRLQRVESRPGLPTPSLN